MKTIIQKIGPLYGEAVNGTVFGQPNGSQAVLPLSFVETPDSSNAYVRKKSDDYVYTADAYGATNDHPAVRIAYTSPVPVHVKTVLYSDSACTTAVTTGYDTTTPFYSGNFGITALGKATGTITVGTTYYLRIDLMAGNDIIKSSAAYPLEAV